MCELEKDIVLLPHDSHSIDIDDINIINNWTPKHNSTLKVWINTLIKTSIIYETALDTTQSFYNILMVIALLIGFLSTLAGSVGIISSTNTNDLPSNLLNQTFPLNTKLIISDSTYNIITISIMISTTVFSGILTIISGIIKLYNLTDLIRDYSAFNVSIASLYGSLITQLSLDPSMREDGIIYIQRERLNFQNIMSKCPEVSTTLYNKGLQNYNIYKDSITNTNQVLDTKFNRKFELYQ